MEEGGRRGRGRAGRAASTVSVAELMYVIFDAVSVQTAFLLRAARRPARFLLLLALENEAMPWRCFLALIGLMALGAAMDGGGGGAPVASAGSGSYAPGGG